MLTRVLPRFAAMHNFKAQETWQTGSRLQVPKAKSELQPPQLPVSWGMAWQAACIQAAFCQPSCFCLSECSGGLVNSTPDSTPQSTAFQKQSCPTMA